MKRFVLVGLFSVLALLPTQAHASPILLFLNQDWAVCHACGDESIYFSTEETTYSWLLPIFGPVEDPILSEELLTYLFDGVAYTKTYPTVGVTPWGYVSVPFGARAVTAQTYQQPVKTPVPEPGSSLTLLAVGASTLLFYRRRVR